MIASIQNNKAARVALLAAVALLGADNMKTNVFFVAASDDTTASTTPVPDDTTSSSTAAPESTATTTTVPCTNVTTSTNTTMTNATDNNSTYFEMVDTTECVPDVVKTTIEGRLTVGFTVPENTTAAGLNSDAAFRGAMAASIKAALSLGDTAAVTVPFLKVPGEVDPDLTVATTTAAADTTATTTAAATTTAVATTTAAAERRLEQQVEQIATAGNKMMFRRVLSDSSSTAAPSTESSTAAPTANTLELEIAYAIELPEADADAVYTAIADKTTFQAAVKSESVAAFTAAGFTGYTVDSVAAADVVNPALAAAADEDEDAETSGAFSSFGAASITPLFVATVGMGFSLNQLM